MEYTTGPYIVSVRWFHVKTVFISEPNGREQSIVQNNHHISMVPTILSYSFLEQEGFTRRENHVFASGRLLPRIRR